MRKLLILPALFAALAFSQSIAAQANFKTYTNARFDYSISYPSDLFVPQGKADNGDGQTFVGDGAMLLVFGTNYIASESLQKDFQTSILDYGAKNVTYKLFKKNYYVISGRKDGKILYQKTMKKPGGAYATVVIEYDESKRDLFDRHVSKIAGSFK